MLQKVEIPSAGKVLSREQKAFNKLLKNNEDLKIAIERQKKESVEAERLYLLYISPIQHQLFEILLKQLAALDFAYDSFKFSKKIKSRLEDRILEYISNFEMFPESAENDFLQKMEAKYLGLNEELSEETNEMAREMFKQAFGIDPGDDFDFNPQNPESAQRIQELIEEKLGNEKKQKTKPKSKLAQAAEDNLKKSLRQLYTGLVKKLHPDSEQDEKLKLEKTEAMKIVTEAYEKNDLPKLLSLQLQYGILGEDKLETLAKDELAVYVKILKKQYNELREEYVAQYRFGIGSVGTEREAKARAKEMKKSFEYENDLLRILQTEPGVKDFLRFS